MHSLLAVEGHAYEPESKLIVPQTTGNMLVFLLCEGIRSN